MDTGERSNQREKVSRLEVFYYWLRLIPLIRKLDLDNRYKPYFGETPKVNYENGIKLSEIDINALNNNDVLTIDPFYVRNDETGYHGHPNAMYTIEMKDTGKKRQLAMWRGLPDSLDDAVGQGLIVDVSEFIKDQGWSSRKRPSILKIDDYITMPYFNEGEGPLNLIRPPANEDPSWTNGVGTITYYQSQPTKKQNKQS